MQERLNLELQDQSERIASKMQIDHREIERDEILAWVRWEFIRRNQEYVRDWVAFDCKFGPWFERNGYWWDNKGPIYDEQCLVPFLLQSRPRRKDNLRTLEDYKSISAVMEI